MQMNGNRRGISGPVQCAAFTLQGTIDGLAKLAGTARSP